MSILFFLRTTANVQEFESSQITKTLLKIIWKGVAVVHNGYNRIRTYDTSVNSRSLYQLSYTPIGCQLTSFTLSAALRYADYTKYRLLNLFLFVLQICGYLRFGTICNISPVCTPGADLSCAACILHHKAEHLESNQGHRARPCASTIDAILHIKTPPDEKGQKSGGVPNV